MGLLAQALLSFALQSALTQQMESLRLELDQVALEHQKVEQELKRQEVFLVQLQEEEVRLAPEIKKAKLKLRSWLHRIPLTQFVEDTNLLPPPSFLVDEANQDRFSESVRKRLTEKYEEYARLQTHWRRAKEEIKRHQLEIDSKRSYLSDLKDSLKTKLRQKNSFRRRLRRSPKLARRLQKDYKLARFQIEKQDRKHRSRKRRYTISLSNYHIKLPLRGQIIGKYGKKLHPKYQTATRNKGVHIKSYVGQEVRTVLPGEVVFVGNYGLFGKLIMIKHDDNYRTLYSGFSKVFIERGQKVNYRQVIGLSGNGFALEYEGIYFEVRRGKKALNPVSWIKKSAKQRRRKKTS